MRRKRKSPMERIHQFKVLLVFCVPFCGIFNVYFSRDEKIFFTPYQCNWLRKGFWKPSNSDSKDLRFQDANDMKNNNFLMIVQNYLQGCIFNIVNSTTIVSCSERKVDEWICEICVQRYELFNVEICTKLSGSWTNFAKRYIYSGFYYHYDIVIFFLAFHDVSLKKIELFI